MIAPGAADPLDTGALRPFQKSFILALESGDFDELALSISRGAGKTWLGAHLLARCMTPGDRLNFRGSEYLICAASLQQARLLFRTLRAGLDRDPWRDRWRWHDSTASIGVADVEEGTSIKAISSQGKTAMGLVGIPLVVADEPASWVVGQGEMMHAALSTAIGKPGSALRVVYLGTLAPASPQHWWPRLVAGGTSGRTFVTLIQGDAEKWDDWANVRAANPLVGVDPATERRLRAEMRRAETDDGARAQFIAYRLNQPLLGAASSLCTLAEWRAVGAAPLRGRGPHPPIVGVDLGGGRSWSAAVAWWTTGRVEAFALAPGVPGLEQQARRDRQPKGLYIQLVREGSLLVDHGRRMQRAGPLVEEVFARWGDVAGMVCDRFRINELADAIGGRAPVLPRVSRWSEASEDILAFRRAVRDGPLSMPRPDWELMLASLAGTTIQSDERGLYRIRKDAAGCGRDDVCAAAVLAAGVIERRDREAFPDDGGGDPEAPGEENGDEDADEAARDAGLYRLA